MTSRDEIEEWVRAAKKNGGWRLIVAWDTFETDGPGDFPVTVMPGGDVEAKMKELVTENGCQIMEVYDLTGDIDAQLSEKRAWHI